MLYISIGETYPLFQETTKAMYGQDGGLLESMEDGHGYIYNMYLNQPIPEEIDMVQHQMVRFRLVMQDNFVLPLVQFGDSNMIFEMRFDPTAYEDDRALQLMGKNNLLTIVLIDSTNGVVKALRNANLPLQFSKQCYKKWTAAFKQENYSIHYKVWCEKLASVPLEILWEEAVDVGLLGESFDLSELENNR